jgi:hypothetical protein
VAVEPALVAVVEAEALEVTAGVAVVVDEAIAVVPETMKPLPMVESVVQREDDGAGCGGGVFGCPWKNVELP